MAHTLICACMLLLQSFLALCDPLVYSLPGSSVHGILPARILEYVAMLCLISFFLCQSSYVFVNFTNFSKNMDLVSSFFFFVELLIPILWISACILFLLITLAIACFSFFRLLKFKLRLFLFSNVHM